MLEAAWAHDEATGMRVLGNSPAEVPADNQEHPPDLSEVASETTSLSAIP